MTPLSPVVATLAFVEWGRMISRRRENDKKLAEQGESGGWERWDWAGREMGKREVTVCFRRQAADKVHVRWD